MPRWTENLWVKLGLKWLRVFKPSLTLKFSVCWHKSFVETDYIKMFKFNDFKTFVLTVMFYPLSCLNTKDYKNTKLSRKTLIL